MSVTIQKIGSPMLRKACRAVRPPFSKQAQQCASDLSTALGEFRKLNGFGRGISAPQVGYDLQIIALNLGSGDFHLFNPLITKKSDDTFTLWDDCMSIDDTLVRVRRHASIDITYLNSDGEERQWKNIDKATSELLQHELDHLNGILMVDRFESNPNREPHTIMREDYNKDPERYGALVDYEIKPTI
jgi:peptide deformylase